MNIYQGRRKRRALIVTANGDPLTLRLDLSNHSPTGFEWGYCGSGPAQLALAILADHLKDDGRAFNLHQRFKWSVIAELPYKRWTLTGEQIDQALHDIYNWKSVGSAAETSPGLRLAGLSRKQTGR